MRVRKAVDPLRRLISGSFVQLDHWDDREGSRFQQELRALSPDHWRQMLQDMAAVGIDTLVFQQGIDARNGMVKALCSGIKTACTAPATSTPAT